MGSAHNGLKIPNFLAICAIVELKLVLGSFVEQRPE